MVNDEECYVKTSIEKCHICSICGFGKAKKNYGALTCSSCKIFFRRNENIDLNKSKCQFNDQCQININNRRICRICRLKKCFSCGMTKEYFRPSHIKIDSKKRNKNLIVNRSELSFKCELILLNLLNNYDINSPISNVRQLMKMSLTNPSKLRLKMSRINFISILNEFYLSMISFIKLNENFRSLSLNDRLMLIKRNIHNLSGLNQAFIYKKINYLNDPIETSFILNNYGTIYFQNLVKFVNKIPEDTKLIKLFLIILTFSTSSDIVYFHRNQCEEKSQLSSPLRIYSIENIYVEILFKCLINAYGYEQASKEFTNLIQILLQQNIYLQIAFQNKIHYEIVQNILNKIEQDLTRDYYYEQSIKSF